MRVIVIKKSFLFWSKSVEIRESGHDYVPYPQLVRPINNNTPINEVQRAYTRERLIENEAGNLLGFINTKTCPNT